MSAKSCQGRIAFIYFFCHAEEVKRFRFLLSSFLIIGAIISFLFFSFSQNTFAAGKSCTANGHQCTGQTYCADDNSSGDCSPNVLISHSCSCKQKQTNGLTCTAPDQCITSYCKDKNGGGECSKSFLGASNCVCAQKQTKGKCTSDPQCGSGTYCADNNGGGECSVTGLSATNCSCKKKQSDNTSCTSSSQCATNYCQNNNGGGECSVTGLSATNCSCKPKQTKGKCTSDPQCSNGYYCGAAGGGNCSAGSIITSTNCECVKNGTSFTPPTPSLPEPPSPPCKQWVNGVCQTMGTALGDFATDPTGFVKTIFDILLSVSGGIALLLIIKSGYQLMTSQGKPEQLQQGRDQLIAAIVGLVFLIFSFVILQVLGFDILRIPGLNR